MIFDLAYLAQTVKPESSVSVTEIIGVISAVAGGIALIVSKMNLGKAKEAGKAEGKIEGKAEALQIGPQPFKIQLEAEFVTRREFEKLENRLELAVSDMKGLFRETMAAIGTQNTTLTKQISNQNERLTTKMEAIATGAYQGRQKLWDQVNKQREDVSTLKATSDVANQIGKLAEVLQPPVIKP